MWVGNRIFLSTLASEFAHSDSNLSNEKCIGKSMVGHIHQDSDSICNATQIAWHSRPHFSSKLQSAKISDRRALQATKGQHRSKDLTIKSGIVRQKNRLGTKTFTYSWPYLLKKRCTHLFFNRNPMHIVETIRGAVRRNEGVERLPRMGAAAMRNSYGNSRIGSFASRFKIDSRNRGRRFEVGKQNREGGGHGG